MTKATFLFVAALACIATVRADNVRSLKPEESQGWKFIHSPEMNFQSEFNADGLAITYQGVANSPNYISASADVDWEAGPKGTLDVTVRGEQERAVYFAVGLTTTDGKTFEAVASGDPKRGFKMTQDEAAATIPLSMFVDKEGDHLEAGAQIARVALIFAIEPEVTNTLYITKVSLTASAN